MACVMTNSQCRRHANDAYAATARATSATQIAAGVCAESCMMPEKAPAAMRACATAAWESFLASWETARLGATVASTGADAARDWWASSMLEHQNLAARGADDEEEQMQKAMALSLEEAEMEQAIEQSLAEADPPVVAAAAAAAAKPTPVPTEATKERSPVLAGEPVAAPRPGTPVLAGEPVAMPSQASRDAPIESDVEADDGVLVEKADVQPDADEDPQWLVDAANTLGRVDPFPSPSSAQGARPTWGALLDDLAEMGFKNGELNETLLRKHNGDLKKTVRSLVELGAGARPPLEI